MFEKKFLDLFSDSNEYPSSFKLTCPKLEFKNSELLKFNRYYISQKIVEKIQL